MKIENIPLLKLKAKWMYDRYKDCFERQVGPAWIIENEGKPLCAFGALFKWQGVCEVWFNLINKEHTISIIRTIKRYIEEKSIEYGVRRIQAVARTESKTNTRFLISLGFNIEGIMHKDDPEGYDNYLFARIF